MMRLGTEISGLGFLCIFNELATFELVHYYNNLGDLSGQAPLSRNMTIFGYDLTILGHELRPQSHYSWVTTCVPTVLLLFVNEVVQMVYL